MNDFITISGVHSDFPVKIVWIRPQDLSDVLFMSVGVILINPVYSGNIIHIYEVESWLQ